MCAINQKYSQEHGVTDFHKLFPNSGIGKHYPWLLTVLNKQDTVLDYGCGKGGTIEWLEQLGYTVDGYDPYWKKYSKLPSKTYDVLYTADCLEHIALAEMPWHDFGTLAAESHHIIDLDPAKKFLPTGENAHVTLLEVDQWCEQFRKHLGEPTHMHCEGTARRRLYITVRHYT